MLKKIIHAIARKRHPWRDMKFDELAEIYTSMSLRSLGFSLIGIFVPIYLYKNGVDIQSIFFFFTMFFLLRVPVSLAAGYVVGRVGPKHGIALSTVLFVVYLIMLLSYSAVGWPLIILAFAFTIANGLFFISYHTDFSKVKDSKHGGKELGWLYIFERAGSALGPLLGGLVATFISAELTILMAILIFAASLIPLFLTNEPVKTHQRVTFKGFKWRGRVSDSISLGAFGVENVASNVMWPLLVGVAIFVDDTYAKVGAIVAIGMAVSMFSARMFGTFIDEKRGNKLLQYGVFMNALVHVFRSFIYTPAGAVSVSTLNEPMTLSYRMPLVKGAYDMADTLHGYRIAYFVWIEMTTAIPKAIYCLLLFTMCSYFDELSVLRFSFIGVGIYSLCMLVQNFPALKKQ